MNTADNAAKAAKVEQEQARAKMAKVYIKATSLKAAAYKKGGIAYNGYSLAVDYKDGNGGQLLTEELGDLAREAANKYISAKQSAKTAKGNSAIYKNEQEQARAKMAALEYGRPVRRYTKAVVLAAKWVDIMIATGRPAYLSDKVAAALDQAQRVEAEWEIAEIQAKEQARAKWEEAHPEQAAQRKAKEQARAVIAAAKEQAKAIMAKAAA